MAHIDRVLGCVLIHATGTTAGFLESLKDKVEISLNSAVKPSTVTFLGGYLGYKATV